MAMVLWEKLRTAHDWKMRPSDLGICSPDQDLVMMTAFTNTRNMMMFVEAEANKPKPVDTATGSKARR